MKTILVPVDFSDVAENAAQFATELAAFYGANLWLYHAYEIPITLYDYAFPVFDTTEMQSAAEHDLDLLKEKLLQTSRLPVNIHTRAEMNVLQEGINNICDELTPDLVVMGLTGKTKLTKMIVGSNTIKAVHDLTYPVLVIPPKATFIPIRKIGFACDYQKVKETTPVNLLIKFVKDFNAELHVLNVDFRNKYFGPDTLQESIHLYEMLEDYKPEYHNIEAEDITDGINRFAQKAKTDWIVVIPKKHDLLHRMFGRSQTKDLLYHTTIPVLCIHE